MFEKEPTEQQFEACTAGEEKLRNLYTTMNRSLEKSGHNFFGSNKCSIADFLIYSTLEDINMKGQGVATFNDLPHLKSYYERMSKEKGIKEVHSSKKFKELCAMVSYKYNGGRKW